VAPFGTAGGPDDAEYDGSGRGATDEPGATDGPHETVLTLAYDTEPDARTVERALGPEVGDVPDDRARASVAREGSTLTIRVAAADLVALRAGANTWLSLVAVAERCVDLTDGVAVGRGR
jgi:KEOPS complex subunit Pcc1